MVSTLDEIGKYQGRPLFLAPLPSLGFWDGWSTIGGPFRLLLVLNLEQVVSPKDLGAMADSALRGGARLVECGGTAGELAHDSFDKVIVDSEAAGNPLVEPGELIATICDCELPLDELLWEVFIVYRCEERIEEGNPPVVVALLNDDSRIAEVRQLASSLDDVFETVENRTP